MRSGAARRILSLAVAGSAGLAACSPANPPAAPPPAPTESPAPAPAAAGAGLYTEAQAERGRQVFNTQCSSCHGLGEFRGRMFQITWGTRPIGHLFQHISTAMPQDRPGSLTPEEYAAVIAYILQLNGHPAGGAALPTDVRALEGLAWPK